MFASQLAIAALPIGAFHLAYRAEAVIWRQEQEFNSLRLLFHDWGRSVVYATLAALTAVLLIDDLLWPIVEPGALTVVMAIWIKALYVLHNDWFHEIDHRVVQEYNFPKSTASAFLGVIAFFAVDAGTKFLIL